MHMIAVGIGIVTFLIAVCVGLVLILVAVMVALMTATAIVDWTIRLVCFFLGLTTYSSFLRTWRDMLFVESSSDAG